MRIHFLAGLSIAGMVAVGVTACTSAAPTVTKTVTVQTPAPTTTILPGDSDMSAAAVCGQFSAYLTVETNAVLDAKNGAVSQTVEAALLASVASGMKGASSSNSDVQAAQVEIAGALDLPNTTAPGLPYDPDAKAYRSAQYHLNEACNAAGSPMSIHVNTGG